MNNKVGRLSK